MRISDILSTGRNAVVFAGIIVIFLIGILLAVYQLIYKKILHGKKRVTIKKVLAAGLCGGYVLVVIYATLLRSAAYYGMDIKPPFSSYLTAWYQFNNREWRNIILNIAMFVPFGFLFSVYTAQKSRFWKTLLAGLVFTATIEVLQLLLGRGMFEMDDIINNTMGAVIGYGIFYPAALIVSKVRKKEDGRSVKSAFLVQFPLLCTVLTFVLIFVIYTKQELGNLTISNVTQHSISEVTISDGITLSDQGKEATIYQTRQADMEEARNFAAGIFEKLGLVFDDTWTDYYDETIFFYDSDRSHGLVLDYDGLTYSYTDFDLMYPEEEEQNQPKTGINEEEVRAALLSMDIFIPDNAEFSEGDGTYWFEVAGSVQDGSYYTGSLQCKLSEDEKFISIDNYLVEAPEYRKTEIISEKEAYEKLCSGKFYSDDMPKKCSIEVTGVCLTYIEDTKGFYRPVYAFTVETGDGDTAQIMIAAA
jgi:glycopeptide antibiotics resistance protein